MRYLRIEAFLDLFRSVKGEAVDEEGQPLGPFEARSIADVEMEMGRSRATGLADASEDLPPRDMLSRTHSDASLLEMGVMRIGAGRDRQYNEIAIEGSRR